MLIKVVILIEVILMAVVGGGRDLKIFWKRLMFRVSICKLTKKFRKLAFVIFEEEGEVVLY